MCTERSRGRANTWSISLRATPLATGPRRAHRGGNKQRRSNATRTHTQLPGSTRGGAEPDGARSRDEEEGEKFAATLGEPHVWAEAADVLQR